MKHATPLIATGIGMTLLGVAGMVLGGWFFWHAGARWQEIIRVFALLGSLFLFAAGLWGIREGFIATAVTQQRVTVEPLEARLGEDLRVQATLTPRRTLQAGLVVFTLVGRERIQIGHGRSRRVKTPEPVNLATSPAETVTLVAGHPQTYTARLTVPPEAMPSFSQDEPLGEAWAFEFRWRRLLGVVVIALLASRLIVLQGNFAGGEAPGLSTSDRPDRSEVVRAVGQLPRGFVENAGQWDPEAGWSAPGFYGATWVTRNGALRHALVSRRDCAEAPATAAGEKPRGVSEQHSCETRIWVLSEHFAGGRVSYQLPIERPYLVVVVLRPSGESNPSQRDF